MLPDHLLPDNSILSKEFPKPSTKELLYRFHSGTLQQILRAHRIWWTTPNKYDHQGFRVPKMEVRKNVIAGYFGGGFSLT